MDLIVALVAVIVALAATATVRIMRAESEPTAAPAPTEQDENTRKAEAVEREFRRSAFRPVTITDGEVEEIGWGAR